ncbi:MAG: YaaA family protein, partial [Candidatus Puniceispirillales bacterium WSBS_2018_MAG_OTU23]
TYQGLEASTLDDHEMAWAQDHLRILSGLYGLLRPMDAIAPYRLEMGSKFNPNEDANKGGTLYDYWGSDIAHALNRQAEKTDARGLVNCASQEYFSAVDLKTLTMPVITPVFKEMKDGKAKIISFFAKKARGAMARYMTQHNITNPDDLAGFSSGGYVFQPDQSNANTLTFLRVSA